MKRVIKGTTSTGTEQSMEFWDKQRGVCFASYSEGAIERLVLWRVKELSCASDDFRRDIELLPQPTLRT